MRKLALLLVVLAAGVAAAWLALRTPRAEAVDVAGAPSAVEDAPAFVDESLESDEAFEMGSADEREPVDVEEYESELLAREPAPKRLRADDHWAHVRVLDGKTGRPVEFFGARASVRSSNPNWVEGTLISRMLLESHADGAADVAASPKAVVLQVEARGYMPFEGELLAEATNGVQAVELARGGSVTGRVTIDKHPVKSVRVRLRRALIDDKDAAGDVNPFDLTRFAGRSRLVWTGRDGRFAFEDLALGTYELDVRGREGARARIAKVVVAGTKPVGVGDIALSTGATLRGRALLPPNVRAKGVRLLAQAGGHTTTTELDKQATFEIDSLPAGPCSLTVYEQDGVVIAGPPFEFELAAGETRDIVLDLRDRAGMWIEARVLSSGRPVRGLQVDFPRVNSFNASSHTVVIDRFPTDETGAERSWQAPLAHIALGVSSNEGMSLGRYERDVVVLPSGDGLVELHLELAELQVDWRGITPMPEFDGLRITVQSLDDSSIRGFKNVNRVVFERRELDWGYVLSGRATIALEFDASARSDGLVAQFQRTLELQPGEHAVCTFTDADRVE